MKRNIIISIISMTLATQLVAEPLSSYPYIAGNTMRNFCKFVIDGIEPFDPTAVCAGDTIFIQLEHLEAFFGFHHPQIRHPYILITHNCGIHADDPVPGKFRKYLDEPMLAAWFTQNMDSAHPKLHPLPIGLANRSFPHGNIDIFTESINRYRNKPHKKMLYMNFSIDTYAKEREPLYRMFLRCKFCTRALPNKNLREYLEDVGQHKFVLSPRGNGLDCHRTWETLLMGSIPIVKTSTLDPLFEDLPVLIIKDWREISEQFLNEKYAEFSQKKYNWEKLYAPYWFAQIEAVQKACRN